MPASRVTPATLDKRAVVILNDTMLSAGLRRRRAEALRRARRRPAGRRSASAARGRPAKPTCCPASSARPSIARSGRGATSASATTATRCSRSSRRRAAATSPRRASSATARSRPAPDDRVLARFDDGAVAAAERRVGTGRVIAWTTTLDDSWTDLAQKPVFLPLVHQLVKYLAQYEQHAPRGDGRPGRRSLGAAEEPRRSRRHDARRRARHACRRASPASLELNEQGVYEVRAAGAVGGPRRPDRRQPRPGRVGPVAARPAGARRRGHRPRGQRPPRPAGDAGRDDSRGGRAPAGPLVVSAARRPAPARGRNGDREPPVAQRAISCRGCGQPAEAL